MLKFVRTGVALALFGALAAIVPVQAAAPAYSTTFGSAPAASFDAPDVAAANAYCKSTGGVVEDRHAVFGTNDPRKNWLYLAGQAYFCQYTLAKDGSRIHLLTSTLYATKPTLAALAYYAKVKYVSTGCPGGANPSSCYCTQLGGSDQFGGATLAGGAWVLLHTTDEALQACIFPDMSSIDSWGLFYHSASIVRGIDLSKVLRYHKP